MTTTEPGRYRSRLAKTWTLGLALGFGWLPVWWLAQAEATQGSGVLTLLYFLLLGLAPIPAVTSATLLVRDFGWARGMLGVPAAVLAVAVPGAWHVVKIALAEMGGA